MVKRRFLVLFILILSILGSSVVFGDIVPRDFFFEVSKGNVPGHSVVRMSGINDAVGTSYEDIITPGGNYVFPVVAGLVNISSTDADDTNGGSGVWNVTIHGLDGDWNPINETLLLNGLTNVSSTLSFIRVNTLESRKSGASYSNEGTVSVTQNALLLMEIIPLHGHSLYSIFSVPAGFYAIPYQGFLTSSEDKTVEVEFQTRLFGESWHSEVEVFTYRTNTVFSIKAFNAIPERSDIKIKGKVGGTTGEMGATLNMILVSEAVLRNSSLTWVGSGVVDTVPVSTGETLTVTNPENQIMMWVGILVVIAIGLSVVASRRRFF